MVYIGRGCLGVDNPRCYAHQQEGSQSLCCIRTDQHSQYSHHSTRAPLATDSSITHTGTGRTWSISEQNIVFPFFGAPSVLMYLLDHRVLTFVKPL